MGQNFKLKKHTLTGVSINKILGLLVFYFLIGCGSFIYERKTFRVVFDPKPCWEKDSISICISVSDSEIITSGSKKLGPPYKLNIDVSSTSEKVKDKEVKFQSVKLLLEGGKKYELFKNSDHYFPYLLVPVWREDVYETKASFDISKVIPNYKKGLRFQIISVLKIPSGNNFETIRKNFESFEELHEGSAFEYFWSH